MAQEAHIYALYDPRKPDVVRYVGKTVKPLSSRLFNHVSEARRSSERCHRLHWIRGLLAEGIQPAIRLLETVHFDGWVDSERHWIAALRADHPLTNSNAGGLGGHAPTEETRQRLRLAKLGRSPTEATRERMRLSKLGKPLSEGHREKLSEAQRRRAPLSEATRLKRSLAFRGRIITEEHRRKISESLKGRTFSVEARERYRTAMLRVWAERKASQVAA